MRVDDALNANCNRIIGACEGALGRGRSGPAG